MQKPPIPRHLLLRTQEEGSTEIYNQPVSKNTQEFIYFNPHFLTENNKFLYHERGIGTSCKSYPRLLVLEAGEDIDARITTGIGEEKQEKIFILG
jgi:hypothetical protein